MNKKFIAFLVILLGVGASYFWISSRSYVPEGTLNKRALAVLENGQCAMCHTKGAKEPFYASIPLAGDLIRRDIAIGLRNFDITTTLDALNGGVPPDSTALAKIEYIAENNLMPPLAFKLVHWKSAMTSIGRDVLLEWIAQERKILNANTGIAKEFENEPVWPLPENLKFDARKAKLGEILYHHTALSGDNSVSCASCHPLNGGGVDSLQTSTGIRDQKGDINAPTVFNAALNKKQFWDGRANNLEEQAGGPPMNPVEMDGISWSSVAERLSNDAEFKKEFMSVYPDGFTEKNITNAIAEFEMTLITPNSPFDRYLKGDKKAISPRQITGYELFKKANCATCHSGQNLGGQTFEYMGLMNNYFEDRGNVGKINDAGRVSYTKDERDTHKFKTPTLRNVELTAPYFHDGSEKTLKGAVEKMAKYQRNIKLSDEDINDITSFLTALTGEYKGKKLEKK